MSKYKMDVELEKEITDEIKRGMKKDYLTSKFNLRFYEEIALPNVLKRIEKEKEGSDMFKQLKAQKEAYEFKIEQVRENLEDVEMLLSMVDE